MADAILMAGGTGGVSSDDVTAGKAHVLQGYRTITSDSDDEVVEGTIPKRGTWSTASEVVNSSGENMLHVRFEEGYYNKDGQYKPTAKIPYAVLTNVLGIDANKILSNLTIAGTTGKVKMINTQDNNYRANKSITFGIDNWSDRNNPIFYVDLPYGNAYYNRSDGHPHVCIDADRLGNSTADRVVAGSTFTSKNGVAVQGQIVDRGDGGAVSYLQGREDWANRMWVLFKNGWYHRNPYNDGHGNIHEAYVYVTYEQLKNLFGIDGSKMLQDYSIAGVPGAIPKWICTTGDVITALGGEGFAWDDTHANRGRGIVAKIHNGGYIQGANWVFLPSPNLKHWNIRKGVNINGEIGTMEDYGAGRVAFRNATFDGVLISGVANIGLGNNLNSYSVPSTEIRDGIIRFNNGDTSRGGGIHEYYADRKQTESITLAHSVNLSPFRTIRLGLKFPYGGQWGTKDGNGHLVGILWALPTSITPNYNISRNSKIHPNIIKRVGYNRNIIPRYWGGAYPSISAGTEYFVDIDVSDLQGHHRIVLGIGAESPVRNEATIQTDVFVTNSVLGISHIEFIN